MERPYPTVTVSDKAERALRGGHPWVFEGEVLAEEDCADGGIVDVRSRKGRWLGAGFFNSASKIRVRVLSRNANDRFDEAFFARRIRYALDYRRTVMGAEDFSACRLLFGEADGFPGLTVDRFEDVLVTEVLCLGIEQRRELIYRALVRELGEAGVSVRAVYERSDAPIRAKEGLPPVTGYYPLPGLETSGSGHVLIRENNLLYDVDFVGGQKTGFFLDQKYNRRAAARLAEGRTVLECFTHTGAFALNVARGGARRVTAVDVSAAALDQARRNAALNGLEDRIDFVCEDVFDLLTRLDKAGCRDYDYILLDPPAFTKSGATVESAFRGYKEINRRAMHLLPRGGYLATCSCSHFMTDELLRRMLDEAASDAAVSLRQIEARRQAPDHPILWGVPETEYLKYYLFQVV